MKFVPPELENILLQTPELARSFIVGGAVRDALLELPPGRDFDVEVFGLGYEELVRVLSRWGRPDLVGRSFGVVKLTTGSGFQYDFTVPRRDFKIGAGHKGFEIEFDPQVTLAEAAQRRDFTINALMYDPRTRQVLDFFGGQEDLKKRVLRHTSAAFSEDPLRVLRGMQFAGRFALTASPETITLSRSMAGTHADLAVERVREEWLKWAQSSKQPSAGLRFLAETGWVEHYPEIKNMLGVPQEPEWHPEGDVFIHTCHCCDALAGLPQWREEDAPARAAHMLAVLAHDFGKPSTTHQAVRHGRMRIISPGHEEAGGGLATAFLERMKMPQAITERVIPLVQNHLFHFQTMTDRAVRRLAKRLEPETIPGLCLIMTADSMGRPPHPAVVPPHVGELLARAEALSVQNQAPEPILKGRHLLELGLEPGKLVGEIVRQAYDAQLEGSFFNLTEALRWLREQTGFDLPPATRARLDQNG